MASDSGGPSILDALTRCVLDLIAQRPVGEATPQNVLDSATEIARRIPETTDIGVRFHAILEAARMTALGSIPDARSNIPAMTPLGLAVPELGHLVTVIARRDDPLLGDAHDYALRRTMACEGQDRPFAAAAIVSYSDALSLASLLDEPYDASESLEALWRGWTLQTLGLMQEAGEVLLRYLHEADPQRARLRELGGTIASTVRGNPPLAEALLRAILRLRATATDVDIAELVIMFELLDIAQSDDLTDALLRQIASIVKAKLDATAFELAVHAAQQEKQRAAAALALRGYQITGDLRCADLAVWRLAAADRSEEAVRLSLDVSWESADEESREMLLLMFVRVGQIAKSEADLREIDKRIVSLGGPSRLAEQLEHLPDRLSGDSYEFFSAVWVQDLLSKGQNSAALRKARDVFFRERRGALPLSLYVDLAIEAGQFARALELATDLHTSAPTNPITSFKLAQVYKWLARDQEAEELMRASIDALDDHPLFAPEMLRGWASIDVDDALARCERALQNPAFIRVHDRLRDLKGSLSVAGQQHD
jgi:hypothetical protein